MKPKHTPGPWAVDSNHEDACFVGQIDGVPVASLCLGDGQDMPSNAGLLADSPRMIELIHELWTGFELRGLSPELNDEIKTLLDKHGYL